MTGVLIWQVTRFQVYRPQELMALSERIKAILYARVSTADQAEHGYSLDSQVERCSQRVREKYGYTDEQLLAVVEPGVSGDDPDRPALNQVLYLLGEGVGRQIVVLHPDRLSRDLHLQHSVWRRVLRLGVDLEFVEVEFDPSNPESMLMFNIQGSIAQYNKAKILANSRRGRRQKVKNGKIPGVHRVYGYTYDTEADTLVINPEERRILLMAAEWLLNGKDGRKMTCNAVAEELARLGIPGPGGAIWYGANLARMLHNELYTGTFYYGKTEVTRVNGKRVQAPRPREEWLSAPVPAIFGRETYDRLQEALRENAKGARGRRTEQYLLKKLVRCGRCGCAAVAGPRALTNGKAVHYYMCCNKGKKGFTVGTGKPADRCMGRNWRQDHVDCFVWEFVLSKLRDPERIIAGVLRHQGNTAAIEGLRAKKVALEEALADRSRIRGRYLDMYAMGLFQKVEELQQKVTPLDRQVAELQRECALVDQHLQQAVQSHDGPAQLKRAVEHFRRVIGLDALTWEGKRSLIERFIRRVTLHEDNTIEVLVAWSPDGSAAYAQAPELLPSSRWWRTASSMWCSTRTAPCARPSAWSERRRS